MIVVIQYDYLWCSKTFDISVLDEEDLKQQATALA
jgi:hypothetical protein